MPSRRRTCADTGPTPHPPGDGGGQREQILVVQVIGGQENILRPLGIAPAQPPSQHAHGTAAAHWEDVGPLRLPHETGDLLHRTPNLSHAAPSFRRSIHQKAGSRLLSTVEASRSA